MSKVKRQNEFSYSDGVNLSISCSPRVCGWAEALGLWMTVETCMLWNALVQSRCPVCVSSDRVQPERKSPSSRCASRERTHPVRGQVSTHYPIRAMSSSWLYDRWQRSKFPNASEDARGRRSESHCPDSDSLQTQGKCVKAMWAAAYSSESAWWLNILHKPIIPNKATLWDIIDVYRAFGHQVEDFEHQRGSIWILCGNYN